MAKPPQQLDGGSVPPLPPRATEWTILLIAVGAAVGALLDQL